MLPSAVQVASLQATATSFMRVNPLRPARTAASKLQAHPVHPIVDDRKAPTASSDIEPPMARLETINVLVDPQDHFERDNPTRALGADAVL